MTIKRYKDTRPYKLFEARQISKALMSLVCIPDNIDPRDLAVMRFDSESSTGYKLRNWYDDELLEWFDCINTIMDKYQRIEPRSIDVKRLMRGMSVSEVSNLFINEYEERGAILNDKHKLRRGTNNHRI